MRGKRPGIKARLFSGTPRPALEATRTTTRDLRSHARVLLGVLPGLLLPGCTDYQLKRNTLGIASSIESLYTEQALDNISKFIDKPDSIPSQLDISSGSVQTAGSASLVVGIPYGNQVTQGASSGFQTVVNGSAVTESIQIPSKAITPSVGNTWQQSWTVSPVADSNALRRLRALYTYVTTPLPTDPLQDPAGRQLMLDYDLGPTVTNNMFVLDASRVLEPRCVICLNASATARFRDENFQDEIQRIVTLYRTIYSNGDLLKYQSNGCTAGIIASDPIKNGCHDTTNPPNPTKQEQAAGAVTGIASGGMNANGDGSGSGVKGTATGGNQKSGGGGGGSPGSVTADVVKAMLPAYVSEYSQTANNFAQIIVSAAEFAKSDNFYVNPRLIAFREGLCWTNYQSGISPVPGAEKRCQDQSHATTLGFYGNHLLRLDTTTKPLFPPPMPSPTTLKANSHNPKNLPRPSLSDFVLFLLPQGDPRLPAPPSAGGSGGGGGAAGGGPGKGGGSS